MIYSRTTSIYLATEGLYPSVTIETEQTVLFLPLFANKQSTQPRSYCLSQTHTVLNATPFSQLSAVQHNGVKYNINRQDQNQDINKWNNENSIESTKKLNLPVTSPFCQNSPSSHINISTDLGAPSLIVNNWTDKMTITIQTGPTDMTNRHKNSEMTFYIKIK